MADVNHSDRLALAITAYTDEDDALALANGTDFRLAGTVWTTDLNRGLALARPVNTGTIGINSYQVDLSAPFGGVKTSGLGRELGAEGLANYQQLQIHLPQVTSTYRHHRILRTPASPLGIRQLRHARAGGLAYSSGKRRCCACSFFSDLRARSATPTNSPDPVT